MVTEIKDRKFRREMEKAGLGKVGLFKDSSNGCFFIGSDDYEWAMKLAGLPSTAICVYSFNHLSVDEWIREIKWLLEG